MLTAEERQLVVDGLNSAEFNHYFGYKASDYDTSIAGSRFDMYYTLSDITISGGRVIIPDAWRFRISDNMIFTTAYLGNVDMAIYSQRVYYTNANQSYPSFTGLSTAVPVVSLPNPGDGLGTGSDSSLLTLVDQMTFVTSFLGACIACASAYAVYKILKIFF